MKTKQFRVRQILRAAASGCLFLALLIAARPAAIPGQVYGAMREAQDQAMNFNLEGKISKVEGETFIVSTQQNIIFHVRYTDKTTLKFEDGSDASAKDLRVGATVKVAGDLQESGEIVAKTIQIERGKESKPQ